MQLWLLSQQIPVFGIWLGEAVAELDTVQVIKKGLYLTLSEAIHTLLVRCPRFSSRAHWYFFVILSRFASARNGNNIPDRVMKYLRSSSGHGFCVDLVTTRPPCCLTLHKRTCPSKLLKI